MTTKPKRIQRKRAKGWRMPENAVYVGRPTKWGNPFTVEQFGLEESIKYFEGVLKTWCLKWTQEALGAADEMKIQREDIQELRGKDLACWCPLDKPCHADILLELANEDQAS